MSFVHLRAHTQYSLLHGAIRLPELVERAKEFGMPALTMTDTNNLFGAIDFYLKCVDKGIKPILGCDLSYIENGYQPTPNLGHQFKPKFFQILVLAKSLKGYQNLCHLMTEAYETAPQPMKGQPAPPKVITTWDLLDRYGEGLIVLGGGIRGEIGYHFYTGEENEALRVLKKFQQRFGEDFYLEVQDHGIPEQEQLNERFFQLGERMGIQVVGTVDCHYLNADDAEAHEVLQCIETGRNLDLGRPKSLVPAEYYFKSPDLLKARFAQYPGAYENTLKVADKVDLKFQFKDAQGKPIYHLPKFRPDGIAADAEFDVIQYFKEQSRIGLEARFASKAFDMKRQKENWETLKVSYLERLESELVMIARTGFASYFLIVSDFIRYAKNNSIPVGPGRGSGAGSIVAYALYITDIDPIEFNLLFERFINPERISMPDFDIDFCQNRRSEVIQYVTKKYGQKNVCQIITYGKLQTRAVIRDVGRVLGLNFSETDEINKLIPDELGISIKDAIEKEPKLREKIEKDFKVETVIRYAKRLEGLYRNAGVHAAGVIITEEPVVNYCPLYLGKDQAVVTQFDKDMAEKIGLVKFDFLGLKTLTVIDESIRLIREKQPFDLEEISYFDPTVFDLISSGDTDGVFQVESSGMKDLCTRIKPSSLEDITAINALYRPGPLGSGMVDDFIDRKHGRKPIVYDVDALEPILKETYGVILYQEQVMQIARTLAGYSLGQADLLRRAMGKKKPEEMAKYRESFVQGSVKNNLPAAKAESIFDLMAKFAEYGFNKSHSAAYGVLTYQTAYLKKHFSAQFMAALMTTEINDTDALMRYIADAKAHNIQVLCPDVNLSQRTFSVEDQAIRFGLEAIKGVGSTAVDSLLEARTDKQPFVSVFDFAKRVSTRKVNKKVMESLIASGALDGISQGLNRPTLMSGVEKLLEYAGEEQAERELGQTSLFDSFSAEAVQAITPVDSIFRSEPDWPEAKRLTMERELVGFFVSGHPLDRWQKMAESWLGFSVEKLKTWKPKANVNPDSAPRGRPQRPEVRIAGLLGEFKEIMTKKGQRMGFGSLSDLTGVVECVFFPEAFEQTAAVRSRPSISVEPVLVTGEFEGSGENPKILVKSVQLLSDAYQNRMQEFVLTVDLKATEVSMIQELRKLLLTSRGKCPFKIEFTSPEFTTQLTVPETLYIQPSAQLLSGIKKIFGEASLRS